MRVLVSSTTGYGHVLPMVPLASALLAAGHDVLWATAADACPGWQRPASTRRRPGSRRRSWPRRAAPSPAARPGCGREELAAFAFPRLFGQARTPQMLADLLPVAEAGVPTCSSMSRASWPRRWSPRCSASRT